jgi:hypothetical protein
MSKTALRVEDNGMICGFPHHDGLLTKLGFIDDSTIEIEIISTENEKNSIIINQTKLLSVNNLREANIVDGIYWSRLSEQSQASIDRLSSKFGYSSASTFMTEHAEHYLIEMACSYGCELFFVVDSLSAIKLEN